MTMQVSERRLDVRDFQDIVDEARRLIPRFCPEWTDHNVSDPGITLVELFAWMTEIILYQLNRLPDEMHERFLDLIGVQRLPPEPAAAEVTFYLSATGLGSKTIDVEVEVATERTDLQEAIVFATTRSVTIEKPRLAGLRAWREGRGSEDYMPYVTSGLISAPVFNEVPVENDALYIGFAEDLAGHSLLLHLECEELEGVHIDPRDPPLAWEYWNSLAGWRPVTLLDQSGGGKLREIGALDPTQGLNSSADVYLHIPTASEMQTIEGIAATWVRIRYLEKEGQGYTSSPRVRGLNTECVGASVPVVQSQLLSNEYLGQSSGEPGQVFPVAVQPILRSSQPHLIEARLGDETSFWTEVEDFAQSSETDRHFVIHYPSSQVRFGPAVRARDGTERQYGAIPRTGADLRIVGYRSGGGTRGNVGAGTVTQLKTSVPYVTSVINYQPSGGGLDQETIDEAKLRGVAMLKRPVTAITREDFERLAAETAGVGAARCVAAGEAGATIPGVIRLLLLPELPEPETELTEDMLMPSPSLLQRVGNAIEQRKSLGTVVEMAPVSIVWAEVDVHLFIAPGVDAEEAQTTAQNRLRRLLQPVSGGPDGRGLSFGTGITLSQIASSLQNMPGVLYIERVRLRRRGQSEELTRLTPPADSVLVLGRCYVLAEVLDE